MKGSLNGLSFSGSALPALADSGAASAASSALRNERIDAFRHALGGAAMRPREHERALGPAVALAILGERDGLLHLSLIHI